MRWGLISWCIFGAGLIGLKGYLDLTARKYPDIALHGGGLTYHVPATLVTNGDSWRADVARLAGCWDVREAGVLGAARDVSGCNGPRALQLDLSRMPGQPDQALSRYASDVLLWRNYVPPREQFQQASEALATGRMIHRADWALHRLEVTGSSWVFLFTAATASAAEAEQLYAGRCFRSDAGTDIGMTCTLVERLPGGVALEYSFGPDAVPEVPTLRREAQALLASWRR
jgi:hypothetical protein